MAGQTSWNDAGTGENDYVVKEEVTRGLYHQATWASLFGKINAGREVKTQEITHKGGKTVIDDGPDSPVWEKELNENNTALFTQREENKGMPTYGDADVKPGGFAQYKHTRVEARQVDSPAYPVVGFESAQNVKRVINDLVTAEKKGIAEWMRKEIDLDALRALFMGASRGLLSTEDGGKGTILNGGSRGQSRSCYNTLVAGETNLTAKHWNATQHENELAGLLAALADSDQFHFTYRTHEMISSLIDDLYFQGITIGGKPYRAVALIDSRNVDRLRQDEKLSTLFKDATPRAEDNLAIYSRKALILDDILYLPAQQMKFFRPSVSGVPSSGNASVLYGAGMNVDPRSATFNNPSNITMTAILGRGAIRRGRRKGKTWFTAKEGDHGKGSSYCQHYHDGWMRNEWYTRDGREEMANDSSLVVYNYDRGFGFN